MPDRSTVYELKIPPDMLLQASDLSSLYICNHHHYFQRKRGHKLRKLYSSVENARKILLNDKAKVNDFSSLGVKTCTSCKKQVVVTTTTPCLQHTLSVSSKHFMCACNCLDEIRDGKIHGINSDMYNCIPNRGDLLFEKPGLEESYICTECGPTYLPSLKVEKTNDSQMDSETKPENENSRDTTQATVDKGHNMSPFPKAFSSPDNSNSNASKTLMNYESISDMFYSISKLEFPPWDVYLQHGRTGVMLHFYLGRDADTMPTKKLTIFCPFLFGAPYQITFTVYALGKKVDSGFLPDNCFENKIQATHTIRDLLNTLSTLQLCLGIYDERFLTIIKAQQSVSDDSTNVPYEIDSKYLLRNHYGKEIRQTVRSIAPERPCERLLQQPKAERCSNCTNFMQNCNIFHETQTRPDKCSPDSHTALTKLSFQELLERYKNLKKSCDYWKSRTRFYMKKKKIKPPVNFSTTSTKLGKLIDTAIEKNLLKQNSVLYLLLMDTVIGLQKQEKEFRRSNGKYTKTLKKPKAKGMRYHPLVIKWCCSLASKCQEKGYESIRNILPLPH